MADDPAIHRPARVISSRFGFRVLDARERNLTHSLPIRDAEWIVAAINAYRPPIVLEERERTPEQIELERQLERAMRANGDSTVPVWIAEGPAVEGTDFLRLVAWVDPVEPEYRKLLPLGLGWSSLLDWLSDALDDSLEPGEQLRLRLAHYTARQLSEISTDLS